MKYKVKIEKAFDKNPENKYSSYDTIYEQILGRC